MANGVVKGSGVGDREWREDFKLINDSGVTCMSIAKATGNVAFLGTVTSAGTVDSGGNITISNTAPFLLLSDSTGSAKSLKVKVDANKAQLRETAAADGSFLVMDLANTRLGLAVASPTVPLDVLGNSLFTGDMTVTGNLTPGGVVRTAQKSVHGKWAKIGATAGWAVAAADDLPYLGTCPASQTASTLVVPLTDLKVGSTITAFHLVGSLTSAGNAISMDAALRKCTVASNGTITDASIGAMTQLSVTATVGMQVDNTAKTGLSEVVGASASYYMLLTCTSAASTSAILQAIDLTVTEA